jgi:hypothetical protein
LNDSFFALRDKPALRRSQSRYMINASKIHRLADSITDLAVTITEIINMKIQTSNRSIFRPAAWVAQRYCGLVPALA